MNTNCNAVQTSHRTYESPNKNPNQNSDIKIHPDSVPITNYPSCELSKPLTLFNTFVNQAGIEQPYRYAAHGVFLFKWLKSIQ